MLSIYPTHHQRHSGDMNRRGLEVILQNLSPYKQWRKLATYHKTDLVYHKTMFDDGKRIVCSMLRY